MSHDTCTRVDQLSVWTHRTTAEMAEHAAADVAACIGKVIAEQGHANVIFSGAESQQAFHAALVRQARQSVDWPRVRAFTVDEFIEPNIPASRRVSAQPQRDLFDKVPLGAVHTLDPAADPEAERGRYEALLREHRPHVACLGVGISGHIALNEPGDTDFADRADVRIVDLAQASIEQLEQDPNFRDLPAIPRRGVTVTLAALMRVPHVFAIVPYAIKAAVIARMLTEPITPALPAALLRNKPDAQMYLDAESAAEWRLDS